MEDKQLNSICKETLFQKVYEKYADSICDFLTYKYGTGYNPKDTVQDIFLKLWQNCQSVPLEKVKSYLFTLANNNTLNKIKHQKIVLKYEKIEQSDFFNETPEFIIEKNEFLIKYERALASLSEEQRVAFLLNKADGLKHQEVADRLGITRKVAEYRIYSAFKILKEKLENFNLK